MKIRTSTKIQSIGSYAFAEVDNEVSKLKKVGIKPIDFGVGDPKEPTPEIVRKSIKDAVDIRKSSGYPSYIGTDEFREEIAKWSKKRFGINLDFQKEITSTIGAKESVFNFPQAFLDTGDYRILFSFGEPDIKQPLDSHPGHPVSHPQNKQSHQNGENRVDNSQTGETNQC